MSLVLIGLNYRTTPVEVRERFSFSDSGCGELPVLLGDSAAMEGAVILSTCNRTEIYCSGLSCRAMAEKARAFLAARGRMEPASLQKYLYEYREGDVVRHLFEVACGLDSMVPGEGQVLGQVKKSIAGARETGFAGAILNRLFDRAIRSGKRARTETGICQGASSISFAAVELARKAFGNLADCRVLMVGAGKMGELAVKILVRAGARAVMVANRNMERALEIAGAWGGRVVSFDNLSCHVEDADVIISSTSAPHFVLTREKVAAAAKGRRGRPLFIIDIAVPRDVEPSVGSLDHVHLFNIDDLQQEVDQTLRERCRERVKVAAIIEEEARRFASYLQSRAELSTVCR